MASMKFMPQMGESHLPTLNKLACGTPPVRSMGAGARRKKTPRDLKKLLRMKAATVSRYTQQLYPVLTTGWQSWNKGNNAPKSRFSDFQPNLDVIRCVIDCPRCVPKSFNQASYYVPKSLYPPLPPPGNPKVTRRPPTWPAVAFSALVPNA